MNKREQCQENFLTEINLFFLGWPVEKDTSANILDGTTSLSFSNASFT
jgi:hypothetical protein